MASIHVRILEVLPTHEPTPLPAFGHPLPALRGEGRERGDQKRFMAPTHVQSLEASASHKPHALVLSFSPGGGEGARRAVEGDSVRFMATGSPSRFLILGRITP